MILACPHCGFSREIDAGRIPAGAGRVTCPRCGEGFSFTGKEPSPPASTEQGNLAALPKAGFWIRFVARLIDGAILALILGVTVSTFSSLIGPRPDVSHWQEEFATALSMWFFIITIWFFIFIFRLAYDVIFVTYCGQTPGKMLLGIKIIRTDGLEMSFGRAVFREFYGRFLSKNLFLGYLMAAFHPQKQSAHDKIADTYVIKL